MSDKAPRLSEALYEAIMGGRPDTDTPEREPDYEGMVDAHRDPEAELDRAEDMHEKGVGL